MAPKNIFVRAKGALIRYLNAIFEIQDLNRDLLIFQHTEAWRNAIQNAPYTDTRRLGSFGFKAYSESDEDGIIAEIFQRIGCTNRVFFEFGVGDGLANNTLNLLLGGWSGFWIDGSAEFAGLIRRDFQDYMEKGQLSLLNEFITRESINEQIGRLRMPAQIDLLSIDIDGNDYWIWESIQAVEPRVVVIEYNATLHPPLSLAPEYKKDRIWNGTNYMGASLSALEALGREKGYSLVGCNYTGVNAFFVKEELVGDLFCEPFTAENHYEPARYLRLKSGHPPGVGPYVKI